MAKTHYRGQSGRFSSKAVPLRYSRRRLTTVELRMLYATLTRTRMKGKRVYLTIDATGDYVRQTLWAMMGDRILPSSLRAAGIDHHLSADDFHCMLPHVYQVAAHRFCRNMLQCGADQKLVNHMSKVLGI